VRIAVAHGRLDTARAFRLAWTAAQEDDDGTTDSSSSPDPSSEPSPDQTPSPQTYDWNGSLAATDTWDRDVFHVRGNVRVSVRWSGAPQLAMWVQDPAGEVVEHRTGEAIDFRMDVRGGDYTFTVQTTSSRDVTYRVVIETAR
jgi:hypothetical protein